MLSLSERLLSDQEACIFGFEEVGVKEVERGGPATVSADTVGGIDDLKALYSDCSCTGACGGRRKMGGCEAVRREDAYMERCVAPRLLHGLDRLAKDRLTDLFFSLLRRCWDRTLVTPQTNIRRGDWTGIDDASIIWLVKQIRSRSQGSHTNIANITVTNQEREASFFRPAEVALELTKSECGVAEKGSDRGALTPG